MKKIFQLSVFFAFAISMLQVNAYASNLPVSTDPVEIKIPVGPVSVNTGITEAMKEYKNLSRSEKKLRIKEAKKALKEFKKEKNEGNAPSTNTLLLVILAILLPPLAVYLHEGEINNKFWIALVLTLLGFLPGIIYALVVVLG